MHTTVPEAGSHVASSGPAQVQISVHTGIWSNELSWNVDGSETIRGGNTVNSLGGTYEQNHHVYSHIVELEPGIHTLHMYEISSTNVAQLI